MHVAGALELQLLEDRQVSQRIVELRLQTKTLSQIAMILRQEFATLHSTQCSVLASAVSGAVRRLLDPSVAAAISDVNRHELTREHRANGGRNSGVAQLSAKGVEARGRHVWTLQEDELLRAAMQECEAAHKGKGRRFWEDVATLLSTRHGLRVNAKACCSREYKIR